MKNNNKSQQGRIRERIKRLKKKFSSLENVKPLSAINARVRRIKNRLFLPSFLREMKRLQIGGLSGGNRLKLITDGDTCFTEFLRAMRSAKESINLETYIFKSDDLGWRIAKLLAEKAGSGVEVNLIYDAIGCIGASPDLFNYMRDRGVEVIEYHPFFPWRRFWNISFRDHRKILVVDGRVAFLGGINIGREYAGKKFGGENWRDTHLRIEGPAVRDVQYFFIENWFRHGGAIGEGGRHFGSIAESGRMLVNILSHKSRKNRRPILDSYLSAIRYAKQHIYITNAYFIPDKRIYRSLMQAVKRGVDVRVLLPGKTDIPAVKYASSYLYKKYLKNGIRVYEFTGSVLHAKTAVIDGIWSTVGSSNLDRRSFRKNLELNAVVLDQDFGLTMEKVFMNDLRLSRELDLTKWERRPPAVYLLEWLCYRFRNLL